MGVPANEAALDVGTEAEREGKICLNWYPR